MSHATPLEMVKYYQQVAEQEPNPEMSEALINEEYWEWCEAKYALCKYQDRSYDAEHELKELADLVYVIYGYANARGWDLDEALVRVHANNLGRMTQEDGTIKRREDGKIIKREGYPKVDLSDLV